MPESYSNRPGPDRPFVVTPYVERNGSVIPELPARCPAWSGPGDQACRVVIHHWRLRKTGPCLALAVACCQSHDMGAFTLYPPGYAPYRRQAVLQLALDGSPIDGGGDRQRLDFGGTVFDAALDASAGQPWSRETSGEPQRSWGTQGRHLELAARLLGLARGMASRVRESIAAVLSVDLLLLRDGCRARGYRQAGAAIRHVLTRLRGGARRALHLLHAGHLAGRWGEPVHWDPGRRTLERLPFRPVDCPVAGHP